jgi:hypothetical protein
MQQFLGLAARNEWIRCFYLQLYLFICQKMKFMMPYKYFSFIVDTMPHCTDRLCMYVCNNNNNDDDEDRTCVLRDTEILRFTSKEIKNTFAYICMISRRELMIAVIKIYWFSAQHVYLSFRLPFTLTCCYPSNVW